MIEVVVHPQSVIHSMVDYADGSVIAQLGNPDMHPIANAMAWPERIDGVRPLDLFEIARLDFRTPGFRPLPCLKLAFDALRAGGTAPAVLNAANEEAVAAFLRPSHRFPRHRRRDRSEPGTQPAGRGRSLEAVWLPTRTPANRAGTRSPDFAATDDSLRLPGSLRACLGLLILVHELGHYLVARWCGVKVLRFSIGKPLLLRHTAGRDGTEWVLAAFPLGGWASRCSTSARRR